MVASLAPLAFIVRSFVVANAENANPIPVNIADVIAIFAEKILIFTKLSYLIYLRYDYKKQKFLILYLIFNSLEIVCK